MTRLRLDLAYDGAGFSGWAAQPGLRTVQGVLEEWIPQVLRVAAPVPVTCPGRTDAGVHARGQVCHLDVPTDDAPGTAATLLHRLGRVLPDDIVARAIAPAPAGFDARFSAIWRRYCYRLADATVVPDPLTRGFIAGVRDRLDVDALNEAGATLLGLRDFAPFCKPREGATTIRTLLDLDAARTQDGTIEITVRADAFCHSMVRSLVGALCAVGSGRRSLDWLTSVSSSSVRESTIFVMPAHGLTLEEVGYPCDDELAARADEARSVRELP